MMERAKSYYLCSIYIVISFAAVATATRKLYVKPSIATACQHIPCYTFSEMLQNPSQYLASGTTVFFLTGVHVISYEGQVVIANVNSLALVGSGSGVGQSHSRIWCTNTFGLAFINSSNISISHLSIEECGANFTGETLYKFSKQHNGTYSMFTVSGMVSAALAFVRVTSLSVSRVSVLAPNGYGLWGTNIFDSSLAGSTFSRSLSGNFQLYYTDMVEVLHRHFFFRIIHSQFMNATCNSSQCGCGLSVVQLQLLYSVDIQISNVTTSSNWARNGANIFLYGHVCTQSTFRIENTVSMYGRGNCGSGLLFQMGFNADQSNCTMRVLYSEPVLSIEGSQFIRNTANQKLVEIHVNLNPSVQVNTGLFIVLKNSNIAFNRISAFNSTTAILSFAGCETVLFQDVNFTHNSYNVSAKLDSVSNQTILGVYNSNLRPLLFTCYNCNFSYNTNSTVFQLGTNSNSLVRFQGITTFIKGGIESLLCLFGGASLHFIGTTTFIGNSRSPALQIAGSSSLYFVGNTTFKKFFTNENGAAILAVGESNLYFFGNTHFEANEAETGGAIFAATSTNVYILGNMTFLRNKAKYGGAMLIINSKVYIKAPAQIDFSYNTAAVYGGGIYAVVSNPIGFHLCFIQPMPTGNVTTTTADGIRVDFTYNKAGVAGSAMYGESFDTCLTFSTPAFAGPEMIEELFYFKSNKSDLSVVSSEPYRVCICHDNEPQCQILNYSTTVYPGETFTLSLIGVGQMLGAVPTTVHAELLSNHGDEDSHSLGEFQDVQLILGPACIAVNYTILSSNPVEVLVLKVTKQRPTAEILGSSNGIYIAAPDTYRYWHHSVSINFTLASCPPGFTLSTYPFQCVCTPTLRRAGIRCDIDTKSIHKPKNYWIGAASTSKGTNDAVIHLHCPHDFCKSGLMDLNLENPDDQCQYNRSGILCGSCQNSFSLALGTSQCLHCSSLFLLLIVPFAMVGIMLVAFLILCNFTVSVGTINGLIFYANIVRTNQEILFPATANGFYRHILTSFIAWLNLDLGIQTCFWDGLDAYGKVWIQLIFPVYIWAIIGAIIILSDRYTSVARLSGRNAVPVLATLFLLSYAKLLRFIVTALAYTTLEYPDGTVVTVWLYDGNVRYLEGKHIPLFLVALAILLFISVPYTVVLLFAQCLQQKSSSRLLFWVRKLKPLFDSYVGIYKDKHRYWTGLMLVALAVLILVYALTSLGNPAVNLLSTISVVTGLTVINLAIGGAYKQWVLTLLDQSFLLNLCILSAATQYTSQGDGDQVAVVYTSVTVSLATFAGICLYHALSALKNSHCLQRSANHSTIMVNVTRSDSLSDSEPKDIKHVSRQVLLFDEFREPVLEYCKND